MHMKEKAEGKRMPFTIIDRDTKEICGSMSYGNISFIDQRVEIGWSWLGTDYIGMGVNMPVKFALLSYAFEVMKMERVEAKTDFLNERAKAGSAEDRNDTRRSFKKSYADAGWKTPRQCLLQLH